MAEEPDVRRAAALAYRRESQAGKLDGPAREAAIAAYRARHTKIERLPESAAVAHIIAWAARQHTAWFWRGVGSRERFPHCPRNHLQLGCISWCPRGESNSHALAGNGF